MSDETDGLLALSILRKLIADSSACVFTEEDRIVVDASTDKTTAEERALIERLMEDAGYPPAD